MSIGAFKEAIKKLTANYTEEEYREYLDKPLNLDAISRKYWDSIKGDEHIKDIACDLACVAIDTGYDAEFLYQMFDESVDDRMSLGETFEDARRLAFDDVVAISYERDW